MNNIEKCVICGKDTEYHVNDIIFYRYGYIEGAGQLCKDCYVKYINTLTNKKNKNGQSELV